MKTLEFETIGMYLFWCYANTGMAHAALRHGHVRYERIDYMVRAKLYKGLRSGTMNIASLYDDEHEKMKNPCCSYCGTTEELSLDHLVSRKKLGKDSADNLVYACKRCNSSKNKDDLLVWYQRKNGFPPILILRRYLKLAYQYYLENEILDVSYDKLCDHSALYRLDLIPLKFPQPRDLILQVNNQKCETG